MSHPGEEDLPKELQRADTAPLCRAVVQAYELVRKDTVTWRSWPSGRWHSPAQCRLAASADPAGLCR
jgi:hypothetical protein